MIIFSELQMQGGKHVEVNGGLLHCLRSAYPSEHFYVNADHAHYDLITEELDRGKITPLYRFVYDQTENRKINTLYKTSRQILLALKLFSFARKNKASVIVFASVFPFCAGTLNWFARIFKQKIVVCQHGDLGVLLLKKDGITTSIFRRSIYSFLRNRDPRYNTFLYYGQSIKDKILQLFPQFPAENVIAIDHPYRYDHLVSRQKANAVTLTIANIGAAVRSKNSHLLFHLAEQLAACIKSKQINIIQVGSLSAEILPYVNDLVTLWKKDEAFIDPNSFDEALSSADYFVYFFENGSYYDLCPSGTFFDAIKYEVPVIAIKNAFFEYYFNRLGNIGYLCNDVEEMVSLIKEIAKGTREDERAVQIVRLSEAKRVLSLSHIAEQLRQQLSDNGVIS